MLLWYTIQPSEWVVSSSEQEQVVSQNRENITYARRKEWLDMQIDVQWLSIN